MRKQLPAYSATRRNPIHTLRNRKSKSEYFDPCQEFAQKSIRCLHRNGGDRSMCGDYFQAYRDCKKAFFERRKEERKKQGAWW
ncbi:cytochrome c oxidase-assembly factor cox23 [Colletotrichum plurivorum]|uniref:Cytochrome c oxidase-assembly factor COX23, mitochondrial n=1 Tax=Colletotrichum plurivorum TaxID=2175906 RepID=A0A8H6KW12_9PEZI|nr:cytochrome c oxidase-assembly factor cox23 [Colletotrichum plurivorum]